MCSIKYSLYNFKSLIVAGILVTFFCIACWPEKQIQKPNIIYILADDLGYGDLSCYGQKKFKTPNIDRLAAEGIRFTQHYSGSTVCAPSRCALMTGLHTGHAQIRGNREVMPEGQAAMKAGTVTIPTILRKAGYISGMFGKWGLGSPGSESDPTVFFDEFYGYNCQREAHTYYPHHLWHNNKKLILDGKTYSHDLIMKAAFSFIRKNQDRPFFCYLPVTIPHASMHAPPQLHNKYRNLVPQFEDTVGHYSGPDVINPVAAFAAMVEHLDYGVGQIMRLLKELDIDDNTIVIFTSDNGPHHEGGHDPDFWNSNGRLRGNKRDLYEGGIRVPMIVRWPGRVQPGTTSDHVSAFWDILPTFCEIAEIHTPDDIDGISLLPTLLRKDQINHDYLYWEFTEQGGKQAIRKGNYKAIKLNVLENPDAEILLYNLKNDLKESKNIADQYPQIIDEMRLQFQELRNESLEFPLINKDPHK
jgi:arylsulfatase A-like enzyme